MLTGAVLAGGKSLRYGKNKALEVFEGQRLVDRGVESLRPFCDPVLVVANDLGLYLDVKATLVRDVDPHQGPLGGIYTALLFSPNDWVLARATDMPFLIPELFVMMQGLMEGFDAVVPIYHDKYEPLLALYNRRCLPAIVDVLESEARKVVSFYRKVRLREVPERLWRSVDSRGLSFMNVNTPEDWKRYEWS